MAVTIRSMLQLALLAATSTVLVAADTELARGWGDGYPWQTLDAAKAAAAADGKGVMVVIWKSWCGACKALKPRFAEDESLLAAKQRGMW